MYFFRGAAKCWYCGAPVYAYKTPDAKIMLFDFNFEPHYASCTNPPPRPTLARVIEFPRQKSLLFGDGKERQ
jgi:hypothetical protein